jgi:hypothetical protein
MPGYVSTEYVQALANIGEPLWLPHSGGWLLVRSIPNAPWKDAIGCYPVFCCQDWSALTEDFESLPTNIVAVSFVADSASGVSLDMLKRHFPDVCYSYKSHYLVDLAVPLESYVSSHHRRNARQALKSLRIEELESPSENLQEWESMYENLVTRHDIHGYAAFSHDSFARQMLVPGLRAFAAYSADRIVGMTLWMVDGNTAYYHLAAYSEAGYLHKASFAMFWQCLQQFSNEGLVQAVLGGGAGTYAASDGLSRFKQGWSNEVKPVYLCGRILDRKRYAELALESGTQSSSYFPAYRTPITSTAA